jgi:hypothetical protein
MIRYHNTDGGIKIACFSGENFCPICASQVAAKDIVMASGYNVIDTDANINPVYHN